MKVIISVLLLCASGLLSGISIYSIQYTSEPGTDNTYPSRLAGKAVIVEGIVTAVNYGSGGFFISEPAGGPWRSIYVRTLSTGVRAGDKISLRGKVAEIFGMTCIQDVTALSVRDSNHPIPYPNLITTGQITTPDMAEAYESTLVRLQNSTFIPGRGSSGKYQVNDGSGLCLITDNFEFELNRRYKAGDLFSALTGIVCYGFGEYSVSPRSAGDVTVMVPVFNQNRSWGRIKSIYK